MENRILESLNKLAVVDTEKRFKDITTLRIGGRIKYVVYPNDVIALIQIVDILKNNNVDYKVLGFGSNILCSDEDYEGCIIKLDRTINNCYIEGDVLLAEAGSSIIATANTAMKNSLTGLEFACGIPATVGGCIYMNAGAYKKSMSDVLTEVFVMIDGNCKWIKAADLEYGYRSSIFHNHPDWIILAAKFKLEKADKDAIFDIMQSRRKRRMETQPLNYPSAGSTFRNPEESPAWKIIDDLGYRGKSIGGAKVSDKHSNFLINNDNASCSDFLSLAEEIQKAAKNKFNIDLIMEVEKFNCR